MTEASSKADDYRHDKEASTAATPPTTTKPTTDADFRRRRRDKKSPATVLLRVLGRPSLWVGASAIVAYWDKTALHGDFVYDDSGSVKNNVLVNGKIPFREHWYERDFWGTPMSQPQSHKSFRPVTTATFRLNWMLAERLANNNNTRSGKSGSGKKEKEEGREQTYGFHVVNVILHGLVSALVTEASSFVFCRDDANSSQCGGGVDGNTSTSENGWSTNADNATASSLSSPIISASSTETVLPQLIAGFLFALHPVHAEAVSNITSRGELLMSTFFLVAFLSYANQVTGTMRRRRNSIGSLLRIYVVPWICTALSLFSKEQGATTLISLVVFDFVHNHSSVREFVFDELLGRTKMGKNDTGNSSSIKNAIAFARRTVILAVETVLLCIFRYWLNGETSPDFIFDQNPAGFSSERFTRVFSVSWVYCLYIRDALFPRYLSPDWSGKSISLITSWNDVRVVAVLALWAVALACLVSLVVGPATSRSGNFNSQRNRRVILVAFFAFTFSPFLLSSNLLVVVGLMKADRVIYLPLMGFCILEALLFQNLCCRCFAEQQDQPLARSRRGRSSLYYWIGYALIMTQLALFAAKTHERNIAWSHSLRLWMTAYQINPISHHTTYNCGYELSLKKRYAEAEQVLRPIGDPHVEGPSNTFVYAMVLHNLNRCDEAHEYINEAMAVVEEKKRSGGVRNTEQSLARTESNLLVARAFCTKNLPEAGKIMYSAVEKDQTNEYAVQQASLMLENIKKQQDAILRMQQQQHLKQRQAM